MYALNMNLGSRRQKGVGMVHRSPSQKPTTSLENGSSVHAFSGNDKRISSGKGFLGLASARECRRIFHCAQGAGSIEFRDGTRMNFGTDDLIYVPGNTEHPIDDNGTEIAEFYFVRLDSGAQS